MVSMICCSSVVPQQTVLLDPMSIVTSLEWYELHHPARVLRKFPAHPPDRPALSALHPAGYLTQPGISRELSKGMTQALINAALADPQELLRQLDSHDDGLTEVQAEAIHARVGLNEIDYEKPLPW